jgi:hypothetical protein
MRTNVVVCLAVSVFLGSVGTAVLTADKDKDDEAGDVRVRIGLAYARQQGIPLDFKRRAREMVGLGSYLVNAVGGCNDCHTAPPFTQDPYAFLGAPKQVNVPCYLAGGTPFGPGVVSRDITPWEQGKPAGLTFREFLHVIRTGEDPDNPGHVLEVMPWPVYQTMAESDIRAVYEYLSSIPAIPANACGVPSED